uniref:Uncharacterized protein n=1 Tax=Glossina pallidipes TaxID=7398 RepID=A0A1A9ZY07_GLOPL
MIRVCIPLLLSVEAANANKIEVVSSLTGCLSNRDQRRSRETEKTPLLECCRHFYWIILSKAQKRLRLNFLNTNIRFIIYYRFKILHTLCWQSAIALFAAYIIKPLQPQSALSAVRLQPMDVSSASSPVLTRNNKEVGLSVSGVGKQKSITLFLPMRFTAFSSTTALNSTFGGWSSSSSSSSSDAVADCAVDALLLMKENVLRFTAFSTDGLGKPKLFTGRSASLEVGFSETKFKVVVGLSFTAFVSCDLSFTPTALLSVIFELVNEIGGITVPVSTVVVFAIFEPLNWNVFGGVTIVFVTPEPVLRSFIESYSERSSVNFEGSVLNSAVEVNENAETLVPKEKLLEARVLVVPLADTGSFEMNAKGRVLEVPVSLHRPANEPNMFLVESALSDGFVMLT